MEFYTVKYDDTSTFTDFSLSLKDYLTNPISITFGDTHYLYVGYYKKFTQFYVELTALNINPGTMAFEYFDGDTWVTLDINLADESQNFFRSGFVYFDRPIDWEETSIDGTEKFYIRMQPSASQSAITMQGLGILLSND